MIIFLVCNVGIILNIFIAIIAVLYDSYAENRNVYQMMETLNIRPQTQADKKYSSLISLPAPLNFLHIFFAPFLISSKNPERINQCILSIGYIPVMIGTTIVFIIYNILLIPLCYVKLWWHKLIMVYVYSKSYRVSRADKFITFCFFWVFGPVTLSINTFTDVYYFLRHLWVKDIFKTQHRSNHQLLSKKTIDLVTRYFKTKNDKIISYKEVATEIRNYLGVLNSILKILQPHSILNFVYGKDIPHEVTAENIEYFHTNIKEYSTLKHIMEKNSDYVRVS
jgi:hypothetical protein